MYIISLLLYDIALSFIGNTTTVVNHSKMRKLLVHKPSRNRWWVGFGMQALVCCPWLGWFVCDLIQTKNWNFETFQVSIEKQIGEGEVWLRTLESLPISGFPRWLHGKESACNAGDAEDTDLIPGLGRSPGRGNVSPLQYSCLDNLMDRGAWWATVHGVTKSLTMTDHTHPTPDSH